MPLVFALLASTTTTTKPSTAPSGSGATGLVLILLIGLAAYFLFIRPRSMAQRRQRETLQELGPGDEVLTGSGIFGTVLDVANDRITIETAPGTRLTVLRSAVARRITPDAEATSDDWSSAPPSSGSPQDADGHDGTGHPPGAEGEGDDPQGDGGQ
jgi:preprotein translocase subunit YajC